MANDFETGKIEINVSENAYNKEVARSSLSAKRVQPYSKETAVMSKYVEELDRYDDFSDLHIDPLTYKKKSYSKYGIEVCLGRKGEVILEHQKQAAIKFLKELRGFGLLADVVGSGKTYEACVILSELASRGNVRSLLIVAPEQVYNNWKNVLEVHFGLGKDSLLEVQEDVYDTLEKANVSMEQVGGSSVYRPLRPLIVTTENFVKWREDCAELLFDVIIVDEAHNLCAEEGEYARAMKLLSLMMQTKKTANSSYCILLSATPHSGNLEHMFRLWYFIRCKGGNPSDFDEKDDSQRTSYYLDEKKYYKEHICRGATTVMEFIQKVKVAEVTRNNAEAKQAFFSWLKDKELGGNEGFTESEKLTLVNEFLDLEESKSIKEKVTRSIASAYHNGVLRSIMIRQPNNSLVKKKNVVNYLYFPMTTDPQKIQTKGLLGEDITANLADLSGNKAIVTSNGAYSVREYVKGCADRTGGGNYTNKFSELMISQILGKVGIEPKQNPCFTKINTQSYYWMQFKSSPADSELNIVPFNVNKKNVLEYKLETTKKILREHRGRVLIFFDYEQQEKDIFERREPSVDYLVKALKNDTAFRGRILDKTAKTDDKKQAEEEFNDKDDAVLIVRDKSFTEGANLQKSNVIINFEVTSDPLAMDQRIGRIFRLGQKYDVTIYSLADMSKLEGYVLMYFTSIGLMSSNSGDATIIAGSNNDRMVTVCCEACGNVKLYSLEDYEKAKRNGGLYCKITDKCKEDDPRGTLMQEITVCNFKCDVCGQVFERSVTEEGYKCVAINNGTKGRMCNSGNCGDKRFYCHKMCAISNCYKFNYGELKDKCNALKLYKSNKNASEGELKACCDRCRYKTLCPEECRFDTGIDAISGCENCEYAECKPKPHVIEFNEAWVAECPVCGKSGFGGKYGKLRPMQARTFDAYIRGAWEFKHDNGASFCNNFLKESNKVYTIKQVLASDEYNK